MPLVHVATLLFLVGAALAPATNFCLASDDSNYDSNSNHPLFEHGCDGASGAGANANANTRTNTHTRTNTNTHNTHTGACLVDRSALPGPIRVIVHGTKNDPFWQQVQAGMQQTARDARVRLDMVLYDDDDTIDVVDAMVRDIRKHSNSHSDSNSNSNADAAGQHRQRRLGLEQRRQRRRNSLADFAATSNATTKNTSTNTSTNNSNDNSALGRAEGDQPNDLSRPTRPVAMIVSLPGDSKITDALNSITNIPIFGINALSSNNKQSSSSSPLPFVQLQGTVAMNETKAGSVAGNRIRELLLSSSSSSSETNNHEYGNSDGVVTGLYVNHRPDVHALKERFDALASATSGVVRSWEVLYLDETNHNASGSIEDKLAAFFDGCRHTVVQLAGGGTAEAVLNALVANGCDTEKHHIVGVFDASSSSFVYDAIAEGGIDFAVSQQPYLQGSHAVLMAALYATTGQKLVRGSGSSSSSSSSSNNGGNTNTNTNNIDVETGPILVTAESDNFPTRNRRVCESEGFPVCSNINININTNNNNDNGSSNNIRNGNECPCTDRSKISIAVITHDDESTSEFWNTVVSGISQAANDFGVSIQKNRFKQAAPNRGRQRQHGGAASNLRLKHAFDINEACARSKTSANADTIDGLVVSLPDASMLDGLVGCESRGIPYVAINAMAGMNGGNNNNNNDSEKESSASQLPGSLLRYVGQKDYESGLEAGRRLVQAGVARGWCLMHANFDTLNDRCHGMEAAFLEQENAKFMGIIHVPNKNDVSMYKRVVEKTLHRDEGENTSDDWSGYGVLSTGRDQIPALISLLEDHPKLLAGTFDLDAALYKESDDDTTTTTLQLRDQIVFGVDQNAFMEGYLSVATMVWKISTSEASTTAILETGPNFVSHASIGTDSTIENEQQHKRQECRDRGIRFCRSETKEELSIAPVVQEPSLAPVPVEEIQSPPVEELPPPQPPTPALEETTSTPLPPIEERPLAYHGKCRHLDRKCGVCEGDCDDDTQCGEGLVCFVRDSLTSGISDPLPGCSTNPIEWSAKDFCVDARLYECKDADSIDVRVGNFSMKRTCDDYVAVDKRRCTEYGRLCRATCGYCRTGPHNGEFTDY